jgi:hypothetical protein
VGVLRRQLTCDGVDIRATDTACVDGNVNVAVLEGLERELEACQYGKIGFKTTESEKSRTSFFSNLVQFFWSLTMKPSAVSG